MKTGPSQAQYSKPDMNNKPYLKDLPARLLKNLIAFDKKCRMIYDAIECTLPLTGKVFFQGQVSRMEKENEKN
ncbi:MAG: hypothetical protein ACYTBY_01845 [Planctomycetota bacterium]|jgi:hypothetical protein